jgi:hypothetical protein
MRGLWRDIRFPPFLETLQLPESDRALAELDLASSPLSAFYATTNLLELPPNIFLELESDMVTNRENQAQE